MNLALASVILMPLTGALLCLLGGRHAARPIAAVATAATVSASAIAAWFVATRGPLRHSIGGWGPGLGIELRADGLSAIMLLTIAVVAALVSIVAIADRVPISRAAGSFFSLWFLAWTGLNALVLSGDIFNLYVTLELTTLTAVGMIGFTAERAAASAALRYLLVALPGSLLYLLGVAILYGIHGTLDVVEISARVSASPLDWTALSFITVGLCLKTALFPLHGWLPPAYVGARTTVAALVSSLIGKSSFYVLLRLWLDVFPADRELLAGQVLGALGAAGLLWCSLLAMRQQRLKLLLAYSSLAQIGYLFIAFPLGTSDAWSGAVYVAISHAAAKASMFLATGNIVRAAGHDGLHALPGLARCLPLTVAALALAGMSLMGMPPSGGFVGKWLLVRAAFERGQWWMALIIIAGGLLAAGYVLRILRDSFLPPAPDAAVREISRVTQLPALALALIAVLLGIAADGPLQLLRVQR